MVGWPTTAMCGGGRRSLHVRRCAALAALFAVSIATVGSGCGSDGLVARNALVIVVDTLRRDHLGAYGYSRNTSPSIDALAAAGIRFDRAYATSGWTSPSVASILTGLYPSAHTVTRPNNVLPAEVETLAEMLSGAGFATAAVVSNQHLRERQGFGQGFGTFDESHARGHEYVSTPGVAGSAIRMLERLSSGDRRFFLFVHFFDPHFKFHRHPEYSFAAQSAGRLRGDESIHRIRSLSASMTDPEIDFIRDLYDGEIGFTDAGIGRLLDALGAIGRFDDTLVLLTADHGEEFLERGWMGHTRTLYDELVRIPLILRLPGGPAGSVVDAPVSLVSLVPTVLELLGIDHAAAFNEPSLVPLLTGGSQAENRAVLAEVDFVPVHHIYRGKTAKQQALIGERLKIIRNELDQSLELYDLIDDPGEEENLAEAEPEHLRELTEELDARLRAVRQGAFVASTRQLTQREIEELRALGYGS